MVHVCSSKYYDYRQSCSSFRFLSKCKWASFSKHQINSMDNDSSYCDYQFYLCFYCLQSRYLYRHIGAIIGGGIVCCIYSCTKEGIDKGLYGTPATVTATAYSGYQFVRWSNGDTYNPYTFAVLQDTTLVAIFEAETQGIDDVIADAVNVYTLGGQIVVETNLKDEIGIYDIVGRKVDGGRNTRFDVPASGVYLVKIGTMPTQKVVVVK